MLRTLPTPLKAAPAVRAAPTPRASTIRAAASPSQPAQPSRRDALATSLAAAAALIAPRPAAAFEDDPAKLCEDACVAKLADAPRVKTPSGLEFQDVIVGTGPSPPVGFQVTVNYVAMTPDGRIFDSSVERKAPYDIRIGSGQVIAGLDEGIRTMRVGGLRRLYIPGNLAFPNGLASAPGRPRVPPGTPVMFDVQLLLVPGLDDEE